MSKPRPIFPGKRLAPRVLEAQPAATVPPDEVPDLRPLHRAVGRVLGDLSPAERAALERRFGVR